MLTQLDEELTRRAIEIARQARAHGNHPFGSLLADAQGNILLESENTVNTERDATGHAETNLVRMASRKYERDFLAGCTLYTSTEPCAMCSGAIYWGGINRVVFALSEAGLLEMTGSDVENSTLALPSREVFARGQRKIEVLGPILVEEARVVHAGFWRP